jgi:KaiC/GvpD/RAD55 family RecA-like ATPase
MKSISPAWPLPRLARKVHDFFAELNYAQRRVIIQRMSTDLYLKQPDRAPDTYAEFLLRTRAPLMHEPPAAARGARPVR